MSWGKGMKRQKIGTMRAMGSTWRRITVPALRFFPWRFKSNFVKFQTENNANFRWTIIPSYQYLYIENWAIFWDGTWLRDAFFSNNFPVKFGPTRCMLLSYLLSSSKSTTHAVACRSTEILSLFRMIHQQWIVPSHDLRTLSILQQKTTFVKRQNSGLVNRL